MRSEPVPPWLVLPQPATVNLRPGFSRAFWRAVASLIGLMPLTGALSVRTATSLEEFLLLL
jgi:hypothetical protein